MAAISNEIFERALALPPEERAALADSLIESLDTETDADASELWDEEIRNRVAELDAGSVQTIPWPDVRARLLSRIR